MPEIIMIIKQIKNLSKYRYLPILLTIPVKNDVAKDCPRYFDFYFQFIVYGSTRK